MAYTREVLSLQFGNYANFIGAHWWNIQESTFTYDQNAEPGEICHDVLYRQGLNNNKQITYTPRLLLVDLEGSLKHLPREGELYDQGLKRGGLDDIANSENITEHEAIKKLKENLAWQPENVEVIAEKESSKNDFQLDLATPDETSVEEKDYNLVENVDSWADFLYARFHPRTVNTIRHCPKNSEKQTLDTFSRGVELWQTEDFEEEFCDRIRQYVEECDFMQGFQTIFDLFNGFSGLATKCMEHIGDEYSKANLAVPVYSPKNSPQNADEPMSDSIRVVNSALTLSQLIEQATLFVPLSTKDRVWRQLGTAREFSSLQYQNDNLYQTSAILATYLDTISMPYRLRNSSSSNTLSGFCSDLNNYGRKMAAAALSLPFKMEYKMDLIDCLDKFEGSLFTQLTPNCQVGTNNVIQQLCVRGIPLDRLKRPRDQARQEQMRMAAYRCESVSQMFQLYLQCCNHNSLAHVTSFKTAMPTRIPYPCEMFSNNLTSTGFLNPYQKRPQREKVKSVPCVAALQSSSKLGDTLETLYREGKRIKIAKLHRFKSSGLEEDDYVEALENLLLFKDNYDDNFEL